MENEELIKTVTDKAMVWLGDAYDEDIRQDVKRMLDSDHKTDLIDSFYRDLEFGTGGLRGIMGAGSNRMNKYTVGAATQGLANYLKVAFKDLPEISVVVGHDVRNNSRKFAEIVADIFSANGIKVYLFDDFRPTPELSFAIRELGCQSGVNITASHNPKEYNGYKAYWSDGAQIISPHDTNIIDYVNQIKGVEEIHFEGDKSKIQIIGEEIDSKFLSAIKELQLSPDAVKQYDDGQYVLINGNQIVMILLNYIMTRNKELGKITGNEYIVKTIVTTETIKEIADQNGFKMYDCYTGFKWIAAVIRDNEGTGRYLGGGEESYGFLAEDFCRDKDAVSAISLMAEALAWAKTKGMNFLQMLQDIYIKYGFSREAGISLVRTGKSGAEEIVEIMKGLRKNPPTHLAGSPITLIKDYADLNITDIATGNRTKMDMPTTSNVLQYFTADGTKVSVRPSGTEPKIKFYVEVKGHMETAADYDKAIEAADAKIEAIKKDLGIE